MTGRISLAVATVLLGVATARGDDAVDRFVRTEMTKEKIPGVAVAIVKRGEVVKLQGYGEANVEHHVPVTADTIFQSGSVGKQFTSALVMSLVEEGKLGLDDPLSTYWKDTPAALRRITVRHLLTHTSGLPDYTDGQVDLRRDYTENELRRIAFELRPEFTPGSQWSYSNTGYVLLGILVHKVTGRFYGDLLEERIFRPLGMKTARIISEADIVPHRAAGYELIEGELKNQSWVAPRLNTTADGALYLSLRDMVAWDRGLRRGAVLTKESWKTVFTPVRLTSGEKYPYGFGWQVEEVASGTLVEHGGAWQGFKTHIARWLGEDVTVIVLTNLAEADDEALSVGVAAAFDPALAEEAE